MWSTSYYNFANYWELRHKVTFDGDTRIILINYGETSIDVGVDIYSDWKEWVSIYDYAKYPVAISAIGGEPLGSGQFVGSTFFLENGWRIKPWEGSHNLNIDGNVYTRESGESPFINTEGFWKINITNKVSAIVRQIEVGNTSSGSMPTSEEIASAVWNKIITNDLPPNNSYGDYLYRKSLTLSQYMATK